MKIVISIASLLFASGVAAQSISPDRTARESRVYSYEQDGVRNYASRPPANGSYRANVVQYIVQTDRYRINGLLCKSDCAAEAQGFRAARARGITDYSDCPHEPQLEALGCSLWVLERKGQVAR
jgi:hypothetical protein